jgi:hypothetical protein
MLRVVPHEDLIKMLNDQLTCWYAVGGGPIMEAFEFDPQTVDLQLLKQLGYYSNRDAWIAGVQVKKIHQFLKQIESYPTIKVG